MDNTKKAKQYSYAISCVIMYTPYVLCLLATIILFRKLESVIDNHLLRIFVVDLVCTLIVYSFSFIFNNSSIYDPYWQIPTGFFAVYMNSISEQSNSFKNLVLLVPVLLYCLKHNIFYMRFWPGLTYEDFRYKNFCEKFGKYQRLYWIFSLLGFHIYPTIMVFLALLPLYYSLMNQPVYPFFTYLGVLWSLAGLTIQTVADEQLLPWRLRKKTGLYIDEGIWRHSRHPNYFGDIIFWQGMFVSVCGLGITQYYWTILGHLINFSTFNFYSVPAMEKHILKRIPQYKNYQNQVSRLIPWFRSSKKTK